MYGSNTVVTRWSTASETQLTEFPVFSPLASVATRWSAVSETLPTKFSSSYPPASVVTRWSTADKTSYGFPACRRQIGTGTYPMLRNPGLP